MTEREMIIVLLNYISDERIAILLRTAKTFSDPPQRVPSVTEKTLCAEQVCRLSDEEAHEVRQYANTLHIV